MTLKVCHKNAMLLIIKGMKALFKTAALALLLFLIITGCATTNVSTEQTSNSNNEASSSKGEEAASESPSSSSEEAASEPLQSSQPAAPPGFILDPHCDKGAGSSGLDIYYMEPPSESLRFVCVHRVNMSPYINSDDSQFYENLSEVGGAYCAYSTVSQNVGCALVGPITTKDLMNVPQQEDGVPTGYVLEDCQQGIGATGKTIYYRSSLPPEEGGRMHTYWFTCVHRAGASGIVNVTSSRGSPPRIMGDANPYCAYSTVSKNVGCALEPITSKDLMNPS